MVLKGEHGFCEVKDADRIPAALRQPQVKDGAARGLDQRILSHSADTEGSDFHPPIGYGRSLIPGGYMVRLSIAVVVMAAGFSTAAFAQTLTAEQRAACKGDYEKYCSGVMPGGGRIVACLNKQRDMLGEACKKVLDAQTKQ